MDPANAFQVVVLIILVWLLIPGRTEPEYVK